MRPRVFSNVLRVFLWGCACTVPAFVLERVTDATVVQPTALRSALVSFLLIAPIEELSKLLAVWIAIYRSEDFREPIDGLLYSVTAALGFASIENILYTDLFGPRVLVLRALFATPAHIMYSAMWGYSMGLARFRRDRELLTIMKGLLVAILFHGTYNLLVAVYPQVAVVSLVPLMLFMAWLIHRRLQDFRRNYPFPPIGEGALILCPLCGAYTLEQEELCSRCKSRLPAVEVDAPRFCGKCRALLDPSRRACPRCGETVDLSRLRPPG